MLCLSVLGTFTNLPIVLVYRKKYFKNSCLYLLFALSIVDLLTAAIVVPVTLLTTVNELYISNRFYCGISYFLRYFSHSLSVVLLVIIAFERYNTLSATTATKLQLVQTSLIHKSKRATIIVFLLCFSVSMGCFYFYENTPTQCKSTETAFYYNLSCSIILGFFLLLLIVLYVKIYLIVRQNTRRILNEILHAKETKSNITPSPQPFQIDYISKSRKNFAANRLVQIHQDEGNIIQVFTIEKEVPTSNSNTKRPSVFTAFVRKDWQVARMFLLVTALFILTWIPWVLTIFTLVEEHFIIEKSYFLNNIINPMIYSFWSKSVRRDLYTMFKSCFRK